MLKVDPSELAIGKPLPWPVYAGKHQLILPQGASVSSRRQYEALLLRGVCRPDSANLEAPEQAAPVDAEAQTPFQELDSVLRRTEGAFGLVLAGSADARATVLDLVLQLDTLQSRYPDAMIGAAHLVHEYPYTVVHVVHTAILAGLLAAESGYAPTRRQSLVLAALMQNIGMRQLQEALQVQKDTLLPAQREAIRSHPLRSRELMGEAGLDDGLAQEIVLQHHEVPSGKGYPRGLKDDQILEETLLLGLTDRYCAKVSARAFRTPMVPRDGLRWLYMGDAGTLPEALIRRFASLLGTYPPGSFVRLGNGEVGVVIDRGAGQQSQPGVSAYLDPHGRPLDRPLVRDSAQAAFTIIKPCAPDISVAISLDALWGFGADKDPDNTQALLSDEDLLKLLDLDLE